MDDIQLEAGYLIVGSGAVGMAFADTLLTETSATVIMVDQHHKPGGHWNLAYPFVTLHQPSAYYGVSSCELSRGRKDRVGLNSGLNDLATGAEVSAYFDDVMRHQFLPTGRLQYFPMCEYQGDGRFISRLTGQGYRVSAQKTVDATYLKTSVPASHTPGFTIDPGVRFMPLNGLPDLVEPPAGYVVIGGGKTGIDACLWLLDKGVDPQRIQWIVSRDAWLLDRRNTQPTEEFFEYTVGAMANQFEAIAESDSIEDLFDRLEAAGVLLRIDRTVRPTMFHGATISQQELTELRRIRNIVRLGRVTALETHQIRFERGSLDTSPDHLHIDCSASAISNLETKPIFAGDLITPQTVRSYQPVFSAAFIAHIEAACENESDKNRLCGVVPLPNHDTDWIRMMIGMMQNQYQWSRHKDIRQWLVDNRLDGMSRMIRDTDPDDEAKQRILKRMRGSVMPAMAKLQSYAAEIERRTTTS